MVNLNYLQGQLRMAADCIRRGLDALAADPDAATARKEITNVGTFDVPVVPAGEAVSPYMAGLVDQLARRTADQGKVIVALTERLDNLTRVLLDIAPDACARHDLFGF